MSFYPLEKLINLHDGYRKVFRLPQLSGLLLCENGRTFVIENACPHMGQRLDKATVEGNRLRCPAHGFEFDLLRGDCVLGQTPCKPLKFFKLAYVGNEVGIELT